MGPAPLGEIRRALLPPELIIDDFIEGYGPVSYEDYLIEFVNFSSLFLSLSNGQLYNHTPKTQQSCGECDCCSNRYELDFKLLGSKSGIYAKRNLSPQKAYISEGVVASLIPRQFEGMEITLTANLLRRYSVNDLIEIDNHETTKFDRNNLSPEADVKAILKAVKCKKNVLFFSTDFLYSDSGYTSNDIIESVPPYLNECYANLFRFRGQFVTGKDTFLAMIIQGYLCISVWQDNFIQIKEHIPLSKSSVFSDLYRAISAPYVAKLTIK